jgi:hypothetical protein
VTGLNYIYQPVIMMRLGLDAGLAWIMDSSTAALFRHSKRCGKNTEELRLDTHASAHQE